MINRRDFFKRTAGITAGGLGLFSSVLASSQPFSSAWSTASGVRKKLENVGVQLYTVRNLMAKDFEGTLDQVARIGYKEVELAGLYERTPKDVKNLLDTLGLSAPSAHIPFDRLRDKLPEVLQEAHTLGLKYVILPWLGEDQRGSLDFYKTVAEVLNRSAEKARQASITIGYHNHDFEFVELEGKRPYDVLLAETDADLVKFELDLYWIVRAGADPLEYFKNHPGRFALCHVKDKTASGDMAPVGQGTIDFAKIFATAPQSGLKHFIVEHDNPEDPLASLRTSMAYLQKLEF